MKESDVLSSSHHPITHHSALITQHSAFTHHILHPSGLHPSGLHP
ncbi:MAG: hypothetical protein ACXW5U_25280 [Thermoanaerobaculia bacterium]